MGIKGKNIKKIIVILGPTSSGKSDLAVQLALNFNGEVVSADSRQVYKGMDIGSGKITKEEMRGINHHLLSIASPKRRFTVSQYQKKGSLAIEKIFKEKKLPIVCGGTAFYISALVDGIQIPEVSPDWKLREKLEKKSTEELYKSLIKKDKRRADTIDCKNRRRLIRALEVIEKTKKPIPKIRRSPEYSPLFLGVKIEQEKLNQKIEKRLRKRVEEGMIKEIERLNKDGISWRKLESFGLEYKWISFYLQKKISYEEAINGIFNDNKKFSKRQMTWWKHDNRIKWVTSYCEAEDAIKSFLI